MGLADVPGPPGPFRSPSRPSPGGAGGQQSVRVDFPPAGLFPAGQGGALPVCVLWALSCRPAGQQSQRPPLLRGGAAGESAVVPAPRAAADAPWVRAWRGWGTAGAPAGAGRSVSTLDARWYRGWRSPREMTFSPFVAGKSEQKEANSLFKIFKCSDRGLIQAEKTVQILSVRLRDCSRATCRAVPSVTPESPLVVVVQLFLFLPACVLPDSKCPTERRQGAGADEQAAEPRRAPGQRPAVQQGEAEEHGPLHRGAVRPGAGAVTPQHPQGFPAPYRHLLPAGFKRLPLKKEGGRGHLSVCTLHIGPDRRECVRLRTVASGGVWEQCR